MPASVASHRSSMAMTHPGTVDLRGHSRAMAVVQEMLKESQW
eukprot:CAMPEP_0172667706 /NCGR_PEP_ID=MMETSP1074-20121228/8602_1 /TAXON_ID=2916 /ORGANISM="Ceratium fusus, Strain PA161109" /LENGTH=41 /DNA_ID= /DNA_START= /DNA_END= /DNA_ORIENTATION=